MTLTLHHLNASRSQRIVWLLAEMGIPHEIVHYKRNEVTNLAPPELLKIHPMGKSPLLEDGDVVIAETGAIAEYLMGKYDTAFQLHPRPGSPDFPRYLEWVHAAEGAIFLPGLLQVYFARVDMTGNPAQAMMAAEREKAADCLMGFQILMSNAQGGLENRPATKAWFEKMQARPAWQKMMEVGI